MYPSDHFDYGFTKNTYLHIRRLESMVVDKLYQRMQKLPCFESINTKYEQMNEELVMTQAERLEKTRASMYSIQRKKKGKHSKRMILTDEEVMSELKRRDEEAWRKKIRAFQNVKHYSDMDQSYCDICSMRHFKQGTVSSLPEHFKIRKWIGNVEVTTISTNTHRTES